MGATQNTNQLLGGALGSVNTETSSEVKNDHQKRKGRRIIICFPILFAVPRSRKAEIRNRGLECGPAGWNADPPGRKAGLTGRCADLPG